MRPFHFGAVTVCLCAILPLIAQAETGADFRALSTSGGSGGLNVPDGGGLAEGAVVLGVNNFRDPQFSAYRPGQTYQFGVGLFEYLEFSGRLSNYPINKNGDLGIRDLSANIKVTLPRLLRYQPEIALGWNDLGGGAPIFSTKYLAASQSFGPLRLTLGGARGKSYMSRTFGGAELILWNTGAAFLLEHNNGAFHLGARYVTPALSGIGNARFALAAQRSVGARDGFGGKVDRSALTASLSIPFGENARNPRRVAMADEPVWIPPPETQHAPHALEANASAASSAAREPVAAARPAARPDPDAAQDAALARLQDALVAAGLERVRVGIRGSELVIEYENHRYNQNEVDAIGIALGGGARVIAPELLSVSVITKKAGLALYQTSVRRAEYAQFLLDGDDYEVKRTLSLGYRPELRGVRWIKPAGPRGLSRVRVDPQLVKFVGTEIGVFDYALALNTQAFVPLWTGAELTTSVISTVAESHNVSHGFFGYAQQRNGLKSAIASQAFWVGPQILNVTSGGKFLYDDVGVQNETTWFLPYHDDQVRVQYTRTRHVELPFITWNELGSVSYLWNYAPLGATVELAYNDYVENDRGPSVQVSRWFGDIQAQLYVRKSNLETRVGFSLAMPLTPRQGMKPGWTHLEGASSFPFKLETKLAKPGECNCITQGVVAEMPMVYSARVNLLNQGRMGREYLATQLQRMREAALIYSPVAQ